MQFAKEKRATETFFQFKTLKNHFQTMQNAQNEILAQFNTFRVAYQGPKKSDCQDVCLLNGCFTKSKGFLRMARYSE